MINYKIFLDELRLGKTPTQVAEEATKAMNIAQAEYDKETERGRKKDKINEVLDVLGEYFAEFYPDSQTAAALNKRTDVEVKAVIDSIDTSVKMVEKVKPDLDALESFLKANNL